MNHESDGSMGHWIRRLVFCIHCRFEYEQNYGKDYYCPACGADNYYVLEEYFE